MVTRSRLTSRPVVAEGTPVAGVVVIHHMPGFDAATKEITRRFAANGLRGDHAQPALPRGTRRRTRRRGGRQPGGGWRARRAADRRRQGCRRVPARRCPDPTARSPPSATARAAASRSSPAVRRGSTRRSTATAPSSSAPRRRSSRSRSRPCVHLTPQLGCPLLGMFGNEDRLPSPEHVDELEAALEGARQGVRVPPLRRRRPRLLRRRPAERTARPRRPTAGSRFSISSAGRWRAEPSP